MKQLIIISIVLLLGASGLAAAQKETVSISGSTSVLPLAEAWAEEFNKMQSDYQITVRGGGSGVGIQDVGTAKSDIGMASRKIKDSEVQTMGDKFTEYVIAKDCICMVVSTPVFESGVKDLTTDQIKGIYSGDITNWDEVGGAANIIFCVAREVGSGTRDFFLEHFFGDTKAETLGVDTNEGSNAGVVTAVTGNEQGIGYVALSYIEAEGLEAVAVEGVMPSMEAAIDGSYPVVRDLYMYTYGDEKPGAKAFLDYALSEQGQEMAADLGFPPAPQ